MWTRFLATPQSIKVAMLCSFISGVLCLFGSRGHKIWSELSEVKYDISSRKRLQRFCS